MNSKFGLKPLVYLRANLRVLCGKKKSLNTKDTKESTKGHKGRIKPQPEG